MNSRMDITDGFFSFKIKHEDLGILFIDILNEKPDHNSPLFDSLQSHLRSDKTTSDTIKKLSENTKIAKIAAIMAKPHLLIKNRMGGGSMEVEMSLAVHAPEIDEHAFAMVKIEDNNSFIFQLFDTPYHYLAWWLDRNASKADHVVPNYMPPPIRFETTVYMLHCIDMFRHSVYQGMIDNQQAKFDQISLKKFLSSFSTGLQKSDLRWLAPSLIALTPGLSTSAITHDSEIFETMAELDFLIPTTTQDGKTAELALGEAGLAMGTEFEQSWFHSAGLEILLNIGDGDWGTLQRVFLAPTGLANHLFLFFPDDKGYLMVNHQAMTRSQLDEKITTLLIEALDAPLEAVEQRKTAPDAAEQSVSEEESKQAPKTESKPKPEKTQNTTISCHNCNTKMDSLQKFCTSCGTKVADKPAEAEAEAEAAKLTCPDCAAEITKDLKFCVECGEKL